MSSISRRHFLYFAGSALATLGLNQLSFLEEAQNYGKVLAQSTPRKLALLVGINQYSSQPLEGCLNDVELQSHLLIHRFGFNPQDILILPDEKANRQGILEAFEEHLIKQAKPGDVVVYHYSGHGSRIFDPKPIAVDTKDKEGLNGTFVPVDSSLPAGYPHTGGTVKDIMGHTLYLLMSALSTENVTAVLDSCFSGGATRDGRVRSRAGGKNVLVSADEKTYQEKWLSQLKMPPEAFVKGYRAGVAKGMVLAATNPQQLAREVNINGFRAGIFTYLLTQYLWQQDSTVDSAIASILPQIPKNFHQTPGYEIKPGSNYKSQPLFFVNNPASTGNAVVTAVADNRVSLWLGGANLAALDEGTVFNVVNGTGKVTLLNRKGLVGEATSVGVVKTGMVLRQVTD
ncbi:caspase family protein [Anabaena cylindrica UHCC 0172]|uniref:caspase family protein n=1 Tax=Anabaena cylindrica TaxID=1165 RepID=UPI002B1FD385|nr:caspase family protein [Anabaena cylindrica]MEA5553178.1 caspase family protein [Anabaena cylindrica UHCC 0172]